MIYIIHAQNLIFDKNIIENNTLACEKISKHYFKGIRDNYHPNLIFVKLKLVY
jgi:hypothetical protein